MRIFAPKHQKLVNQCYPSGRTPDKKPKSSETSYLLYYVNSRRSKLEKVSTYLVKRTTVDLNRRRVGNVAVTLEIMSKVVNNCKENLNVFVKDFLQIMKRILSNNNFNNDVTIVELVERTFCSICQNVDGALCSGDAEFTQMYQEFVELYFRVVNEILHNDDLLLKGCIDISNTTSLASSPQINHFIPQSVNFILLKFLERNPRYKIPHLGPSIEQSISKRLSRTQTRTVGLDDIADREADLAVKALRSYFTTTETDKLTLSIRALLKFLQITPNKELLEFICNGIPVQLRYIVLLLLIRQLNDKSSKPIIIMKLISSLLVSDVSIVGLSILDMMRKLLKFQMENVDDHDIVRQCCATLTDLNNKVYYRGQSSDMLYEFLLKLRSTKKEAESAILKQDVTELLRHMDKRPCISLELFLDLAQHADSNEVIPLFDIVEEQVSGGFLFSKLFQFICQLSSTDEQEVLIHKSFEKYKSLALLSGLNYFIENVTKPETAYYLYHAEAAKFLGLSDYQSQVAYKRENKLLFTKEDLLNFYSDAGSNKYSKKGSQILTSQPNQMSTSDLLSDNYIPPTSPEPYDITQESSVDALTVANSKIDEHDINKNYDNPAPRTFNGHFAGDIRSWRSLKSSAPKVEDLKRAIGSTNGAYNGKRENSLRGSQSVKSRVTNITFLLSELKSVDDETSHIYDPDEDEVVGLDKSDIARSHSLKIAPSISTNENKRKSLSRNTEVNEDDFKDAPVDVTLTNTRGKLF